MDGFYYEKDQVMFLSDENNNESGNFSKAKFTFLVIGTKIHHDHSRFNHLHEKFPRSALLTYD